VRCPINSQSRADAMWYGHRGVRTTRTPLGRPETDEIPDLVLKFEVVARRGDHYVLRRPGDASAAYSGHVANFELLATRIFRAREEFRRTNRGRGANVDDDWKRERERLMEEWDQFPDLRNSIRS
jgi:hypothetical protein